MEGCGRRSIKNWWGLENTKAEEETEDGDDLFKVLDKSNIQSDRFLLTKLLLAFLSVVFFFPQKLLSFKIAKKYLILVQCN